MLLFSLCCISTIFGMVLIHSATKSAAASNHVAVQLVAFIIGIALFVLFSVIDLEIIADRWKVLLAFSTVLILLLIPFGVGDEVGSAGWLRFFGIGIQPAEVVKVLFIIMLARQIQFLKEYKDLNSIFSIVQLLVHFGYIFLLIMFTSRDLGSGLVYMFIFVVMLYAGGLKLRWFALGGAAAAAFMPVVWKLLRPYQKERILAPFDPTIDPTHTGVTWQTYRSKIAIASGKWTGQGLGQGTQTQSGTIPEQQTDFIFSVAGEELGLIGCLVIILLLACIIIRCIYVGYKARNTLSALVCIGFGAMLLFQTIENIGMCIGLTPVIGLTLPFFSYGGSSIATLFVAMGIVCGVKMRTISPWKRQI